VQHISDLHSKFALRPHDVQKYGRQSSNLPPLRIGEEKRRKKKIETAVKKYYVRIC